MKKCLFCGKETSFLFEGKGEFNLKPICPLCQADQFSTKFNTVCQNEEDYSLKL